MNDLDLLQDYAQRGSEEAFSTLVNRHLSLVYGTALRQLKSPQLAEDAAQSVFLSLAKQAGAILPNTILPAWLYRAARNAAIDLQRGESRRQLREQIAFELANMKSDSAEWAHIEPLLDEALETLDEADRAAILLRYFESKSLREVGENLGTSEEAARKRVSRAVEQLRAIFSRRGVTIGASSLAVLLAAQTIQAVPAGLSATITAAVAFSSGAIPPVTTIAVTKAIAMTLFQKAIITTAIAAAVGAGIYNASRETHFRAQTEAFQQQQNSLTEQNQRLQKERDDAVKKLAATQEPAERSHVDTSELLKLRAEVARWRDKANEFAQSKPKNDPSENDATASEMNSWLVKTKKLKERVGQLTDQKIPEFQLLTDQDWLDAARAVKQLESDDDYKKAIGALKNVARNEFANTLQAAFSKYAEANGGQMPSDFSQLKNYFATPVDDAILQRYEFTQPGTVAAIPTFQVDKDGNYEFSRMEVSPGSVSSSNFSEDNLKQPIQVYMAANSGQFPTDPAQLLPYAQTPDQKAALQKLLSHGTK